MIVVDDGSLAANAALAARAGARYVALGEPRGLNAARNAGIARRAGELLAFIDDDVEVHPGWLAALLGRGGHAPRRRRLHRPDHRALRGPRRATAHLRARGRRRSPTPTSAPATARSRARGARTWRSAAARFDAVGRFDPHRRCWGGDEEEWEQRLRAAGGRIRYVAARRRSTTAARRATRRCAR